jgi:hypothetical protein
MICTSARATGTLARFGTLYYPRAFQKAKTPAADSPKFE